MDRVRIISYPFCIIVHMKIRTILKLGIIIGGSIGIGVHQRIKDARAPQTLSTQNYSVGTQSSMKPDDLQKIDTINHHRPEYVEDTYNRDLNGEATRNEVFDADAEYYIEMYKP